MRTRLVPILLMLAASTAAAQTLPTDDPMLRKIWDEGMNRSQTVRLIQTLTDSIGPRLTGTPQMTKGQDWLLATYAQWGVTARKEQYGTWLGWRRGLAHLDLIQPRPRTLEGTLLAWSGGTPKGKPAEGGTVILPSLADSSAYEAWYPTVKGKHVLISAPQPHLPAGLELSALRPAGDLPEDGGRPERGEPGVAGPAPEDRLRGA